MKIFLDIGAHVGETVEEVSKAKYKFDKIFCFEPVKKCCELIAQKFKDEKIEVLNFGLYKEICIKTIYNPGSSGASLFNDKDNINSEIGEKCKFIRISEWVKNRISNNDMVFMKINCEGAECDILEDLLESNEINKINYLMIDFDVRKIPSQRFREVPLRKRLKKLKNLKSHFSDEVMVGKTHGERIKNWLLLVDPHLKKEFYSNVCARKNLIKQKVRNRIRVVNHYFRERLNLIYG